MHHGRRKGVRSLQLQSQIEVLRLFHGKSAQLENEYFDKFYANLNVAHQRLEQTTDIRNLG